MTPKQKVDLLNANFSRKLAVRNLEELESREEELMAELSKLMVKKIELQSDIERYERILRNIEKLDSETEL